MIGGSYPDAQGQPVILSTAEEYDTGLGVPPPDVTGDGKVDFKDFSKLAQYWLQEESSVDIGPTPFGDQTVDIQDIAVLAAYWLRQVQDPTLVAHWKLDETEGGIAHDSVGGSNAFVTGDQLWRPEGGKVGGALELDGIDDFVFTTFSLNPADTSFSVFAWVKGGGPGQVIISQTDGTGWGSTWLGADAANGTLTTGLMSFFPPLESESVITDGDWHHVGLIYDLGALHRHLYVDGTEVAKDTSVVAGVGSDGGLYFGADKDLSADSFWSGLIDDVRIYNRAVTP